MIDVERVCFVCGKSFPYSKLIKKYRTEWAKFVYYCEACNIKNVEIVKPDSFQVKTKSYNSFAEKYSHLKDAVNWWDK